MEYRDFINWLDGFLEGKTTLNENDINLIKEKASNTGGEKVLDTYPPIQPLMPTTPYPMYPPYTMGAGDVCPAGGSHEYPYIWHGTTPPSCKKCGKSEHKFDITCGTGGSVPSTNPPTITSTSSNPFIISHDTVSNHTINGRVLKDKNGIAYGIEVYNQE